MIATVWFGRIGIAGVFPLVGVLLLAGCLDTGPRGVDTPLVKAVRLNDAETLTAMLADGNDPNATDRDGDSLVYIAVGQHGGREVLQVLIGAGADLEKGSGEGRTPLQNAAGWCSVHLVRMLLDAGANPHHAGRGGQLPVDSVCKRPQDRRDETMRVLLAAMHEGGR